MMTRRKLTHLGDCELGPDGVWRLRLRTEHGTELVDGAWRIARPSARRPVGLPPVVTAALYGLTVSASCVEATNGDHRLGWVVLVLWVLWWVVELLMRWAAARVRRSTPLSVRRR